MAVSVSSSSLAAQLFAIKLYDATGHFVATVDVPSPVPPLLLYKGNYYVYSSWIYSRYVQAVPYTTPTDLGAPPLSVVAFPEF